MDSKRKLMLLKIAVILGIGLLAVLIMYRGYADPDFFSQYYVGKGIVEGQSIYKNFTDNKSPLIYFFFAGLNLIFKNNYVLALLAGSFILNILTIYGLVKFSEGWFANSKPGSFRQLILITVLALFVGSLTLGGIYAESLGVLLLIWSQVLLSKGKYFIAGLLFAGGFLSRQTLLFYLPFVVYLIYAVKDNFRRDLIKFLNGIFLITAVIFIFLMVSGDFLSFIHNAVYFNTNYSLAVAPEKWLFLLSSLLDKGSFRPYIALVLVLGILFIKIVKKESGKTKFTLLLACSFLATFSGGIFYQHHLLQFSPVITVALGVLLYQTKNVYLQAIITCLLLVSVAGAYLKYRYYSETDAVNNLGYRFEDNNYFKGKKYLQVISYYPRLYFDFNKKAPDKYFQPFFLSRIYNTQAAPEVIRHRTNMKIKNKDTAYVALINNRYDEEVVKEYLTNFKSDFNLVKVSSRAVPGGILEVYWSGN